MGRNAIVRTLYDNDAFEVHISPDWLDDKEWNPLPIRPPTDEDKLSYSGTKIEVDELSPSVSRHFENDAFINELQIAIGEHFTFFLQGGFKITVNDILIKPVLVEVLVSDDDGGPAPYIYQKEIDGVTVSITVGLNTGRSFDESDEESAEFERNRSATTAGWTVFL